MIHWCVHQKDIQLLHLVVVADFLRNVILTINVKKIWFCNKEAKCLVVDYGNLKTDPERIDAMKNFEIPITAKQ